MRKNSRLYVLLHTLALIFVMVFAGSACDSAKDELLDSNDLTIPVPTPIADERADDSAQSVEAIDQLPGNQSNSRVTIINDDVSLQKRMKAVHREIEIEPAESEQLPLNKGTGDIAIQRAGLADMGGIYSSLPRLFSSFNSDRQRENISHGKRAAQNADALILTLVAEVAPPELDGQILQATSVDIQGNNAYVSYSMRGERFLGAIDVINIKNEDRPEIISQALFSDSDVHSLTFSNGNVYAAQATNEPSFEYAAAMEVIDTKRGRLVLDNNTRVPLTSFAATSIAVSGNTVYVTSGNTGGLSIYDRKSLELEEFIELDDARWVSVDRKTVAVMQGTPGRVVLFDEKDLDSIRSFQVDGADIAESKSTVQVMSDIALIATGTGGLQIIDLNSGDVLATIAMPIVEGLPVDVTVTNAVSADDDLIFISNGEAGVYVAQSEKKLRQYKGDSPIPLELVGKLQFDTQESVNHVTYKGKHLFIASGLGGLKIVKVEKSKK